jgi:hypothetical protein
LRPSLVAVVAVVVLAACSPRREPSLVGPPRNPRVLALPPIPVDDRGHETEVAATGVITVRGGDSVDWYRIDLDDDVCATGVGVAHLAWNPGRAGQRLELRVYDDELARKPAPAGGEGPGWLRRELVDLFGGESYYLAVAAKDADTAAEYRLTVITRRQRCPRIR